MPTLRAITEGGAKLAVPDSDRLSGPGTRAQIFYNPAMRSNRDVTVLFGMAVAQDGWTVLDALGGTGAKGIRLAVEAGHDLDITINDRETKAFEAIKRNIRANRLVGVKACNQEYNAILSEAGFDWIDIDPYGSPVKYLDLALRRVSRNGIISMTATDTAPLCGTKPDTCLRRYMSMPMRSPCAHEFGLRILVGSAVRRAAAYDYGLEPLLAYYHGHYFRAFFRKRKGAGAANTALDGLGYVSWEDGKGYSVSVDAPRGRHAGPLWAGPLWDRDIVRKMLDLCQADFPGATVKLLDAIHSEMLLPPYHYDVDQLASMTGRNPLKTDWLIQNLKDSGFESSGVHYSRKGFRTDAGIRKLAEIFNTA